jgi:tRNA(His) 5'-end guanylyltransferase
MIDALGDRIKEFYENRFRITLPRKAYTIIRIDGKAFHTYTKGLYRPFDKYLMEDMDATASYLCQNIMGAKLAYVQSDEISILITDFDDINTQAWYDNNMQKMVSVSSSMATAEFNRLRLMRSCISIQNEGLLDHNDLIKFKMAEFDSRVMQIPQRIEVENYFIWRQQDAIRNSISSVAQSLYSTKDLQGKNGLQMKEMILEKGFDWDKFLFNEKSGRVISKVYYINDKPSITLKQFGLDDNFNGIIYDKDSQSDKYPEQKGGACECINKKLTEIKIDKIRTKWEVVETPVFTENKKFLDILIP